MRIDRMACKAFYFCQVAAGLCTFHLNIYNEPLASSKNPHFQNEAKCRTFLVKMSFICIRMKNQFHIKD